MVRVLNRRSPREAQSLKRLGDGQTAAGSIAPRSHREACCRATQGTLLPDETHRMLSGDIPFANGGGAVIGFRASPVLS